MKIGDLVRFNHERDDGPVHRVVSVMSDGMIEIHDMGGYFAPHLFVVADDVAAKPLPCPFCGHDHIGVTPVSNTNGNLKFAHCNHCGARGSCCNGPRENAVAAWNKRMGPRP